MSTDSSRPHKTCPKCGESFPATTEFFNANKKRPDGLNVWCKGCLKAWRLANRESLLEKKRTYHAEHKDDEEYKKKRAESKRRYRAENKEHIEEYNRQYRRAKRDQRREYNRQFREKNPDYQLTYLRKWREANPDKDKEYNRKYQAEKPEYFRDHNRRWREANREKTRNAARIWAKANPERGRVKKHRRWARKRKLADSFTLEDWQHALEYFGHCCAVCGRPSGENHTIAADHWIALSDPDCPGTVPTNIVPLCHGQSGCNNSKFNKKPRVWLSEIFSEEIVQEILAKIQAYFDWVKARGVSK